MAFLPEYVLPVYVYSIKWQTPTGAKRCKLTSSPVNEVSRNMAEETAWRLRSNNTNVTINYEGRWENIEILEQEYKSIYFQGVIAEDNEFSTAYNHPELIKILKSSKDPRIIRFLQERNI